MFLIYITSLILICQSAVGFIITPGDRCGPEPTILHASEKAGRLRFPTAGKTYGNNLNCTWILQAPEGRQVEFVFVSLLTESCCDKVQIRDGNSSSAPILAELRGNVTSGPTYISSFGTVSLHFQSDDSITGTGFAFDYRIATVSSASCNGGDLTATEDFRALASPGYLHGLYPNNLHCFWNIYSQEDTSVEITFVDINMELCCDYILVRDGLGMASPTHEISFTLLLQEITLTSTGHVFQVILRTDASIQRRGFKMYYRSVPKNNSTTLLAAKKEKKCGGVVEVPDQGQMHFTSPNFPGNYDNNLNCVWILKAPPGNTVTMWFKKVHTEECCDFIKIRDGPDPNSKKLGVLSGEMRYSHPYTSSSNILRVEFESDLTDSKSGFFAVFGASRVLVGPPPVMLCRMKKLIKKEDGVRYMDLPIWPVLSRSKEDCSLVISTSKNSRVTVGISIIENINSGDVITVSDGRPSNKVELGMVTTSSPPINIFYSTQNAVVITFTHDPMQILRPFFLFYYASDKKDMRRNVSVSPSDDDVLIN